MELSQQERCKVFMELGELLETAGFSLETVRMALSIGRCAHDAFSTLDDRIQSGNTEEREAALVALEALDNARGAYLDLAEVLDEPEREGLGYEIRFWSTFEWCWSRLFTEPVRGTGQSSLRHELVEAARRTRSLHSTLEFLSARTDATLI